MRTKFGNSEEKNICLTNRIEKEFTGLDLITVFHDLNIENEFNPNNP